MSELADVKLLEELASVRKRLLKELRQVIVGQDQVLEELLIGLFAGGHCLLEGPPGVAKTLMVRTLAGCLSLTFNRVQFTPDVMPSDVTGSEVLQEDRATGTRAFEFVPGPVFAQVLLADEINRAPPKTQSALLEAMQERQVTVAGKRHALPEPMLVLATQNPIEQEGTYPLPEAQLDRFMMKLRVTYPSDQEEVEVVRRTTGDVQSSVKAVLQAAQVVEFQHLVRRVPVPDPLLQAAVDLARRSRPDDPQAPANVKRYVAWGAGPRAGQYLILAAKARAALAGHSAVGGDDLRAMVAPVLRHRMVLSFEAEAEGVSAETLIQELIGSSSLLASRGGRGRDLAFLRSADAR